MEIKTAEGLPSTEKKNNNVVVAASDSQANKDISNSSSFSTELSVEESYYY